MLVSQEVWQQAVTMLGLLRCSVHHSAPATFLCPSAPLREGGRERKGPGFHSSLLPERNLFCVGEQLS